MKTSHGVLSLIDTRRTPVRTSLYADDVVVFSAPVADDIRAVNQLLKFVDIFSSLNHNPIKSAITPIRCSEEQLAVISHYLKCATHPFPIKYLGLPLSLRKPTYGFIAAYRQVRKEGYRLEAPNYFHWVAG